MPPKLVVGLMGSSVANGAAILNSPEGVNSFLDICAKHSVQELDTARVYNSGKSEEMLGKVGACERFRVSTKAPAFAPGSLGYENILKNCELSIKALGAEIGKGAVEGKEKKKIDVYYLHGPDKATPLEEQCRAIGKLYDEGKFERFGVSNLSDDKVKEVYKICKREGYCLPKVYQGGFNPIGRGAEETLIPLLRELGMVFYAFSPLGGGMLAKPLKEILSPEKGGRFDEMKVFGDIYLTDPIKQGLGKVQEQCDKEGIPLMEATMRWFMHHSVLGEEDGVIVGASKESQLEGSLSASEQGPLSEELQAKWEELHTGLKNGGAVPDYYPKI
jgi:aflatoxin B1 aldehyde reductase